MRYAPAPEEKLADNRWVKAFAPLVARLRQWDENVLLKAEAEDSIVAYLVSDRALLVPHQPAAAERTGRVAGAPFLSSALFA